MALVMGLGMPEAAHAGGSPQAASSPQAGCGHELPAKARRQAESARHRIAFAMQPAPAVGRHFGIDLVVCPRAGSSLPSALRVDADMPAHRHGMNYRPTVRGLGNGRYRVDGLMFHMAGSWRLSFDVSTDGHLDRLTHTLDLE